jgi:glucose/arabinose dehydrogenase
MKLGKWQRAVLLTMIALLALVLAFAALAITARAQGDPAVPSRPPTDDDFQLTEIATGLNRPLYLTNAGDERLFVLEQGGLIKLIVDGVVQATPFLDLSSIISPDARQQGGYSERGLLGLAFHPDYANNRVFYVHYTDINGDTVIARYLTLRDNPNAADPSSAAIVLTQSQPYANHNGGQIAFGPDGYLYIALGDGGGGGDPLEAGQDLQTWLGKILRIDPALDGSYSVPADNPFVNGGGLSEIWAYGLRNPWRFSFDALTGDLYIADVGQNAWEEVNFQAADSAGGENYGWNFLEGNHPYSGRAAPSDVVMPVAEYAHSFGSSVSGGYVYRGENIPALVGAFIYGDFTSGMMWSLYRDAAGEWQNNVLTDTPMAISSFGVDAAGELYVLDYSGRIQRFDPAS